MKNNVKKIKKYISILVLLLYSVSALGQGTGTVSPVFAYKVSKGEVDCENNKVCYTISVKLSEKNQAYYPVYYDGASFQYIVDPDVFTGESDYIMMQKKDGEDIYSFNSTDTGPEVRNIGKQLGFKSDVAYWIKGTIDTKINDRKEIGKDYVNILKVCLTPKKPLKESKLELHYPFIFDRDRTTSTDDNRGIVFDDEGNNNNGNSGVLSYYTRSATDESGIKTSSQNEIEKDFLWTPDDNRDGGNDGEEGSIGTVNKTEGEGITNTCCYEEPTKTGDVLETFAGISTLDRNVDGTWVDSSKGGFLKLESKTLGFVPTRMTTEERNKIENPEEGMVIWNKTLNCLEYYKRGEGTKGPKWVCSKPRCKKNN